MTEGDLARELCRLGQFYRLVEVVAQQLGKGFDSMLAA
jgi:hypothetical protein